MSPAVAQLLLLAVRQFLPWVSKKIGQKKKLQEVLAALWEIVCLIETTRPELSGVAKRNEALAMMSQNLDFDGISERDRKRLIGLAVSLLDHPDEDPNRHYDVGLPDLVGYACDVLDKHGLFALTRDLKESVGIERDHSPAPVGTVGGGGYAGIFNSSNPLG